MSMTNKLRGRGVFMSYSSYRMWKENLNKNKPFLSVVIPAFNEEDRIIPTVGAISSHLSSFGFPWEIIIADDGSTDNTATLIKSLNMENLRLLRTPKNEGKGNAVRSGMLAAKGNYILFTDADNSTPIEEFENLLIQLTDNNFDIAIGSRAADGGSEKKRSFVRNIISLGLRTIVRYFFKDDFQDTQCGFKLFNRNTARKLYSLQSIMGFSFDLEILFLAKKFGYKISEVPVNWIDAPGSKVNVIKESFRFVATLAKIWVNDRMGKYKLLIEKSNLNSIAIISSYPPSKASLNEYAYHFVKALNSKSRIRHITLLVDDLEEDRRNLLKNISSKKTKIKIMPSWAFNDIGNFIRISKALREIEPDVVLFNIQFATFGDNKIAGALGLLAPMCSKLLGFPTIVLLHNIMETVDLQNAGISNNILVKTIIRIGGSILTRLLLFADLVALTIPKYVDILQDKYRTQKAVLIPHGSFDEIEKPNIELPNGPLQILTFGKFGTYKKVEILIDAFQKLTKRDFIQDMELVIAGTSNPNSPEYLEEIAEKYKQVPNLRFTGYVQEKDVPNLFAEAAVVVFPYTSTTGSSGVLHQAGSFGKAVVLPQLGDFIELIAEEGYQGIPFAPDDSSSLADAIARVLYNSELRKNLGYQNFLAAKGISISDIADWYIFHFLRLENKSKDSRNAGYFSRLNGFATQKKGGAN